MRPKKGTIVLILLTVLLTVGFVFVCEKWHPSILQILFALIGTGPMVLLFVFTMLALGYAVWHELRLGSRNKFLGKR
jgi:Zn-dependent protease with chaperone function